MAVKIPPIIRVQEANDTPYDNTTSGMVAEDVQAAIDELANGGGKTASPGFTFGRSGNVGPGTYLLNETVPSNLSGRTIFLTSGSITDISIANENVNTFDVRVEEHDGTTYTTLTTVSVVAAKTAYFTGLNVAITLGKQLAVKVSSGSAKNLVVNLQLRGLIA